MTDNNNMLYSLMGMCQKAGKLVSGNETVESAVKGGKAVLLIIAEDIGDSMLKKLSDKAEFYGVETVRFGLKDLIGQSIGKGPRSAVVITDKGFAKSFLAKYQTQHPGVNNIG